MGGCHWEGMEKQGFGRNTLRIYIIQILKRKLQSTFGALMVFRQITTYEESIKRTEVKVRVRKLKNKKAAQKDKAIGDDKGFGKKVADWIQRLFNMAFESDVRPEDWRSAVLFLRYKDIKYSP